VSPTGPTAPIRARRFVLPVVLTLLAGFVLVACGGGGGDEATKRSTTTTTTAAPTTTTAPPPNAPLTGLPDPAGDSLKRPAVSVKVENTQFAVPQAGLEQADDVYEEVVEGNITRLLAIFNSQIPPVIGPVRSVRELDPDLVWPLGGIFAFSGGAPSNVDAATAAPVNVITENNTDILVRNAPGQPARDAPHNLYALGPQLFGAGGQPVPPPPLFQYYAKGAPPNPFAPGVLSFHVNFDAGYDSSYTWDAPSGTWQRTFLGGPHMTVSGKRVAPTNVVIQFTQYTGEAEATSTGEGDVWVFSDGQLRQGRWIRPDHTQPARYVDQSGQPLLLRPGQTWIELLPVGNTVDVEYAPPPAPTTAPPTTIPPTTTTKAKKAKGK
jgi:Protein of unknown function (DUF3048) N-terminal domain/Protein of unknown function (DUF3048) C-terminal domain